MTTAISQAEAQLNLLLNQYLNDEAYLQSNFPFVLESVTLNNVLSSGLDQQKKEPKTFFTQKNKNQSSESTMLNSQTGVANIDANELKKYNLALDKWSSRLTALLLSKQPKTRLVAVVLIKQTCEQSTRLFSENLDKWILHLLNLLTRPELIRTHQAAISAIISILDKSNRFTDLQKDVVIPSVAKFNLALISLMKVNKNLLLNISSAFIWSAKTHPSLLKSQFHKIIMSILPSLDGSYVSSQPSLITIAADCISELCVISGKDSGSERWRENVLKTIGSINNTLIKVYYSVDTYEEISDANCFGLDPFNDDYLRALPLMVDRCISLTELLVSLLTIEIKETVLVPVQEILHLVTLFSCVNNKTKKSNVADSQEYTLLLILLPKLHLLATRVIAALVISLKEYLIPYVKLITQTSVKLHLQSKTQRQVKVSSYAIISLLCENYGYGSTLFLGREFYQDIFNDLNFNESSNGLQKLAHNTNQPSNGNTKRKHASSGYISDNPGDSLVTEIKWSELHFSALKTLSMILKTNPSFADQQIRNKIETMVIRYLMYLGNANDSDISVFADDYYYKSKVHVSLFELLITLLKRPVSNRPTILPVSSKLFIEGLLSHDLEIVKVCKSGLEICESVIHPKLPFLSKPQSIVFNTSTEAKFDKKSPTGFSPQGMNPQDEIFERVLISDTERNGKTRENIDTTEPIYTEGVSTTAESLSGTKIESGIKPSPDIYTSESSKGNNSASVPNTEKQTLTNQSSFKAGMDGSVFGYKLSNSSIKNAATQPQATGNTTGNDEDQVHKPTISKLNDEENDINSDLDIPMIDLDNSDIESD